MLIKCTYDSKSRTLRTRHPFQSTGRQQSILLRHFLALVSFLARPKSKITFLGLSFALANAHLILVGKIYTHMSATWRRTVTYEKGKELAKKIRLEFFDTSAKDNVSVVWVLELLVDDLVMNDTM